MAKETFYFSHDANARHDVKIQALMYDYGMKGYGLYWTVVEMLRQEETFKLPKKKLTWNALAMQMHSKIDSDVDAKFMQKFCEDCIEYELFQEDDGQFWSQSLLSRMDKMKETKEARQRAAQKRWEAKEEQTESKSDANAEQVQSKDEINHREEIKEMLKRYPSHFLKLNKEYWDAMRETRSTKKIADSVIHTTMTRWKKYDPVVVEYGLRIHLKRKPDVKENYACGVMSKNKDPKAVEKLLKDIDKQPNKPQELQSKLDTIGGYADETD